MSTNVEIDEHVVNTLKTVNFCYDTLYQWKIYFFVSIVI